MNKPNRMAPALFPTLTEEQLKEALGAFKADALPTDIEDHDGWVMVGENGDLIAISEDEAAIGPITEDEAAEIERLGHRGFIEERRRKRSENN